MGSSVCGGEIDRGERLSVNNSPQLVDASHKRRCLEPIGSCQGSLEPFRVRESRVVGAKHDTAGGLVGGDVGKAQTEKRLDDLVVGEPSTTGVDRSDECEVQLAGCHGTIIG